MSAATKRKIVWAEAENQDILPTSSQRIAKVLAGRGNNLHEVEDEDGNTYIVSMPTKFRKTVWVKRGGYVLVSPIAEGDKVKGEIEAVLLPATLTQLAAAERWPERFADALPRAQARPEAGQGAYALDDMLPPSSSSASESDGDGDGEDADESSDAEDGEQRPRRHRVHNPNHRGGIFAHPQNKGPSEDESDTSSRDIVQ